MKTATIYFSRTVHIYKGGDVDVLGVKVGSITGVHPDGDKVKVTIKYKSSQHIPASASAVILTPTLVADRVVQLTPAYTGGPVLADKAVIPLQKSGVPLELDQVFDNLNQLAKDVGPNGANKNGALSNLMNVAADNLSGNGNDIHSMITSVSQFAGTLDDNKSALFQTIKNLQSFTTLLAQHDSDTRAFTNDLAKVGDELNGDRTALGEALSNLNSALGDVTNFVQSNKANLQSNISGAGQRHQRARQGQGPARQAHRRRRARFDELHPPVRPGRQGLRRALRDERHHRHPSAFHLLGAGFGECRLPTSAAACLRASGWTR